ncbi:hypothetical protein R6Q59_012276 [Mikania micrantha]
MARRLSAAAVIVVVVAVLVSVGSGFPAEDLVVRLPGQPMVGFKQYAGFTFEGPGCSSMGGGAFTELCPFFQLGNGRGLRRNSKSWNKASNHLFVESPAGVGCSYSNTTSDYTTGDANTGKHQIYYFTLSLVLTDALYLTVSSKRYAYFLDKPIRDRNLSKPIDLWYHSE